jgi:hypothetical protein
MEMDCLRTQATLSAVHDGEHTTDENAAAARGHVSECESCRGFESEIGALAKLPSPTAPDGLVDRVMAAVSEIAAERALVEQPTVEEEQQPVIEEAPATSGLAWFTGRFSPRARMGIYAAMAVAAGVLVLVAVTSSRGPATQTASERQSVATSAGSADLTFSKQAPTVQNPAAAAPAPAHAPDYLTYRSRLYAPGALLADANTATQSIGTVTTAFGSASAPAQAPAFRSPVTDGSIVVAGPDGSRLYAPVVRMLVSVKYQLVAGNAVDRFGVWPTLPSRFPTPSSPDGSPTFVAAGADALGVQIYTAKGVPQSQGFAVAPGTPSSDPAGSNPNWTWWEPILVP